MTGAEMGRCLCCCSADPIFNQAQANDNALAFVVTGKV